MDKKDKKKEKEELIYPYQFERKEPFLIPENLEATIKRSKRTKVEEED